MCPLTLVSCYWEKNRDSYNGICFPLSSIAVCLQEGQNLQQENYFEREEYYIFFLAKLEVPAVTYVHTYIGSQESCLFEILESLVGIDDDFSLFLPMYQTLE